MINPDFLVPVTLVDFTGLVTYDNNGYAILPAYVLSTILGSVQPVTSSQIKFMKEGTHYSDYINMYTDYPLKVDSTGVSVSDYIIFNNLVYKIISDLDYQHLTAMQTNHVATLLCRDNRISYNGTSISIPYPEIDSQFFSFFNLIKLAKDTTGLTALWAFQQELRPAFPYCVVNIVDVDNIENTNYTTLDGSGNFVYSKASVVQVTFGFYSYDKIEAFTYAQMFLVKMERSQYMPNDTKLKYMSSTFNTTVIEELYENRSIFRFEVTMTLNAVCELSDTNTTTINTIAYQLSGV